MPRFFPRSPLPNPGRPGRAIRRGAFWARSGGQVGGVRGQLAARADLQRRATALQYESQRLRRESRLLVGQGRELQRALHNALLGAARQPEGEGSDQTLSAERSEA